MKARKSHLLALLLFVAASLIQIWPRLWETPIARGQLSKQTFVAEMARSFNRGDVQGIFPKRHFLEPYHPGPIAWAEEVPVFTGSVALLQRASGLDYNVAGKILACLSYFLLLAAAWRLGGAAWALPFALFPVFRLYASLSMPELPMAALALWAVVLAKEKRWAASAAFVCLATMVKYYAAFTGLGLLVYALWETKRWKPALGYLLAPLPALLYLGYFLKSGIANPILEYKDVSGTGHYGGAGEFLGSLSFYSRMFTWNLNKNPTLVGTALALGGAFCLWRARGAPQSKGWSKLLVSLLGAQLIFLLLFAPAFYVHDYYGIQIALLLAILAGVAVQALWDRGGALHRSGAGLLLLALFVLSHHRFIRSSLPQFCYSVAARYLAEQTKPQEWGIWIMDGYGESALHMADRTAWMIANKTWTRYAKLEAGASRAFQDPRAEWLGVILTGDDREGRWRAIQAKIAKDGWTRVTFQAKDFNGSPDPNDLMASLWIVRRR